MAFSSDQSSVQELPDTPGENPHYLRAITDLGEQQEIVANSDIYAASGIKLLAKGAPINRKQFECLLQHKLSVSIDYSLSLESAVDATELSREAGKFLERDPLARQLAARAGDALAVTHELAKLILPSLLETRLTVMRGTHPDLFQHSLRTGMIAFALAQRLRLPASERPSILLAALCHDMGELHTDPAILVTEHRITPEERRYIHVHPITGYVLLNEMRDIPAAVGKAVLQHHERLDGSGYPYDLKSAQISHLAKLIALADVVEAVHDRVEPGRMDMLLRANRSRFDPEIVNALRDLLGVPNHDAAELFVELDISAELGKLAIILDGWDTLKNLLESQTPSELRASSAVNFLFERMNGMRGLILQAGFDPGDILGMMNIAGDDPQILGELRNMLSEIDWLLHDLANEIDRRSPELTGVSKRALDKWVDQLRLQRLTGDCVIWSMH